MGFQPPLCKSLKTDISVIRPSGNWPNSGLKYLLRHFLWNSVQIFFFLVPAFLYNYNSAVQLRFYTNLPGLENIKCTVYLLFLIRILLRPSSNNVLETTEAEVNSFLECSFTLLPLFKTCNQLIFRYLAISMFSAWYATGTVGLLRKESHVKLGF